MPPPRLGTRERRPTSPRRSCLPQRRSRRCGRAGAPKGWAAGAGHCSRADREFSPNLVVSFEAEFSHEYADVICSFDETPRAPGRVVTRHGTPRARRPEPAISFASLACAMASCQMRFKDVGKYTQYLSTSSYYQCINRNITEAPGGWGAEGCVSKLP